MEATTEFVMRWAGMVGKTPVPKEYFDKAILEKVENGEDIELAMYPGGVPSLRASLKLEAIHELACKLYATGTD